MRQYRSVIKTNKFPQLTRRVFTTADGLKSDNVTAMRFKTHTAAKHIQNALRLPLF